jgi:hypothetical protein
MTDRVKKHFERRAGLRFGYLVRQLIDDGWRASDIAAAIGADKGLVTTWHKKATDPTYLHKDARKGLTDQTIQGIHDGLGVQANYLFMSTKGLPNTVRLKDGGERPCEPGELDHKLFKVINLEEAREKRDVAALQKHAAATDAKLDAITTALERLGAAVAALSRDSDDQTRNAR